MSVVKHRKPPQYGNAGQDPLAVFHNLLKMKGLA
jgi:hypothetical protein